MFKSKAALKFLENVAGRTDPRYSQRGLSREGCTYVANEIQRFLETAHALDPVPLPMQAAASQLSNHGSNSPDAVVVLKTSSCYQGIVSLFLI